MTRTFFTSDTHFGHKNIFKFCPDTRRGKDIEEHDELLIQGWNNTVGPKDAVYHHGDFCMGNATYTKKILDRLNGRIYFIYGNHDNVFRNNAKLRERFEWIGEYKEIYLPAPSEFQEYPKDPKQTYVVKEQKVCMFHFPIYEWNRMHHGSFHLYGHVHGSVQIEGRAMDVGIDTRPDGKLMTPWSWEEVYRELIVRPIRAHGGAD